MAAIRLPAARKGTNGRDSISRELACLFLWLMNRAATAARPEAASRMAAIRAGPYANPRAAASLMSPPPTPQPPGDAMAAAKRIRNPVAIPVSEDRRDGGSASRRRDRDIPAAPASSGWAVFNAMPMQSSRFRAVNGSAAMPADSAFRNGAARTTGQKSSSALSGTFLVRRSYAANPAVQAKTSRR